MRYTNIATASIDVAINDTYTINAMSIWDNDTNSNKVTLYIKAKDINILDLMEEFKEIYIQADRQSLKMDIVNKVVELYNDHKFDKYIERFEYMMKCFDIGNAILEERRLNEVL